VNYGFYIGATADNVDELKQAHRTPGIKIFIGSSTGELLVDDQEALERIFEETRLPICAHCEDETTVRRNQVELAETRDVAAHSRIRTREAAILATRRAVDLSFRHRHPFHVLHVTTKEEVDLLRDHRNLVTAEACIHHLWFHTGDYERLGSRIQTNPSVKEKADNDALWKGLRSGALQVVATDHAPHTLEEKAQPYPRSPSGLPAVENSLALMMHAVSEGRCTLRQVAAWMCEAPARVWNIVNKGWIEEGFDADLVLVDPELRHTIRDEDQVTRCGWSPWHGVELTGGPVMTWSLGRLVHDRGRLEAGIRGREAVFDHGRGGYWRTG
jgi:dihydroorotase